MSETYFICCRNHAASNEIKPIDWVPSNSK
jgi:hypothetical protein